LRRPGVGTRFLEDEPPEVAATVLSSWDEQTEYALSMTEALFHHEHRTR